MKAVQREEFVCFKHGIKEVSNNDRLTENADVQDEMKEREKWT